MLCTQLQHQVQQVFVLWETLTSWSLLSSNPLASKPSPEMLWDKWVLAQRQEIGSYSESIHPGTITLCMLNNLATAGACDPHICHESSPQTWQRQALPAFPY